MPIIDGKEVQTIKYDGKIFALECRCGKEHKYFIARCNKYGENLTTTAWIPSGQNVPGCSGCSLYPWIILPKQKRK